jgi:predicted nuclease of predicted toxin-antitoxin system
MKFYVDECLSPKIATALNDHRGHRAVHAARDLGLASRDDEFHVARSRERGEILITSNHHDFKKRGRDWLKHHPGIVVLDPGAWTNTEDLMSGIGSMLAIFRLTRVGAKPPLRNTLYQRRLVISSQQIYVEDYDGLRFDLLPRPEKHRWRRPTNDRGH